MTVKSGPAVYISTFLGQQILAVDGAVGTTVAIHTAAIANSFSPEDIVVGPDKKIYICDPGQNKIYRVRQDDGGFETIYNQNSNASLPAAPEGPSFNGSDLYFNTHFLQGAGTNGGVWKIAGATGAVPVGGFTPTQVFDSAASGEGTVFGTAGTTAGKLLFVERSTRQVKSCDPSSCNTPTTLIQNPGEVPTLLDNPIGIAVNSAGDIFVANAGSTLQNVNHFDSGGGFVETYASFSGSDYPFFLEFDALNRLYVVTNDLSGAGGKVWRIDPPGGETKLVFLVALSNSISGVAGNQAVGLGLGLTDFVKQSYAVSGSRIQKKFIFTADEVDITFTAVSVAFELIVFREEIPEALLGLQETPNFTNPTPPPAVIPCAEYNSDLGTCVVYEEGIGATLEPVPTANFTGPVNLQLFYTPSGGSGVPVLAHALDSNLQNPVDQYDENELTGFTLATKVGDPTGMNGDSCCSRHVALNTPQAQVGTTFCTFQTPLPGQIAQRPQVVTIRFKIAASGGNCQTGPYVTNAVSQLWLFNTTTQEFVTPTSKTNTGNFFFADPLSGQNSYNIQTRNLVPGTYIFTMTSNSVSAQFSNFVLQ